jgi:NitT/TauT family transport system substrate-binding protein
MILRWLLVCLIAGLALPAAAQQRVLVVTQRQAANGALFLAAVRGYFKAEGIELQVGIYRTPQEVVDAVASGRSEFGLSALTPAAFNLAGKDAITIIAAQLREKRDYEGDEVIAANAAYDKGLRRFADLAGKVVAIQSLGSAAHYQLAEIARAKGFDFAGVTVKPLYSFDDMTKAVAAGTVDAAMLPARYARDVLTAGQGRLIGWYSEIGEQQTGALFAAPRTIGSKRAMVEKFVRAYRRGVADYAQALLRRDRFGKRVSDSASQDAAGIIARAVFPGRSAGTAIVEANAPYMDPKARIDVADLARQIDWYKAQGFVEKNVEARNVVDLSFTAGR